MKRILFLTNMYPSEKYPSYGIFVKKTYDWLIKEYDVTLVKICKSDSKLQKLFNYMVFYIKAIFLGCFNKYDCVYAHYISHSSLAVRCIKAVKKDLLIIGNIHGEDVFSEFNEFKKNQKKSERFIERANYIISPSEMFAEKLCKEYCVEREKVFVSPSGGVDTKLFRKIEKNEAKKKVNLEEQKRYIGFVSRIEKGKGWDIFVDAMSRVTEKEKDVQGLIVGSGSEQILLENYIVEKGMKEKIDCITSAGHDKLVYLYNAMDIFCFPSRRTAESLGLVGLEAMACEVPCVITEGNGPATYAKEGYNCYMFNPYDSRELEEKILLLLDTDEEKRRILEENERKTAMQYDANVTEDIFLNFFRKVLK